MLVVDDYAHHPTEVSATLAAARQAHPRRRLVALFQPHLYSRTRDFAREFGRSLNAADVALVTEIYPSREAPIPGVSGRIVVEQAVSFGHRQAEFLENREATSLPGLEACLRPGDLLLTMGAGDVYRFGEEFLKGSPLTAKRFLRPGIARASRPAPRLRDLLGSVPRRPRAALPTGIFAAPRSP